MKHTIDVQRSRVHNLKNVSVSLPRNAIIVFTGLSGSGKSSLAFDTIYAEGQRRYMESLSAYARQFLDQLDKPDVDHIDGLSPAISIDQKAASHNPRSTVGTITEIYDYLRLLFASIGTPFCPSCKKPIQKVSLQEIKDIIVKTSSADSAVQIMAPLVRDKKGSFADLLDQLKKDGFSRVLINNTLHKLSEPISLKKNEKHSIDLVIDRLALNQDNQSRLHQSLETALHYSDGLVRILNLETQKSTLFSEKFSCPTCMYSLQEISHRLFSFNSPLGACETCRGLGEKLDFDLAQVIEFPKNPIRSCTGKIINLDDTYYGRSVEKAAKGAGFSLDTPYNKLTEKQRNLFLYGNEEAFSEALVDRDWEEESSVRDIFGHYAHPWEGVITNLRRRYQTTQSEPMRFHMRSFMSSIPCESCQGTRLKSEALNVKIQSKTIADLCQTTILDLVPFFETLPLTEQEEKIANQVLKEIRSRLGFLKNVGLDYLTLDRRSGTLSGGEYQRIRLATQIGAGLTGVLYVLDEPSIGLHQRDNQRLIKTLQRLRDIGNTLLVVEHDEETIKAADWVVEIGPCAGNKGGNIVFSGAQNAFLKTDTLTAQYLQQKKSIPVPSTLRKIVKKKMLTLTGATENNLKNLTISFPLNTFICITGVSGSGKSTLIHDILHRALMKHFHNSKPRPGKYKSLSGLQHLDKIGRAHV